MHLPARLTIVGGMLTLDGGTNTAIAVDENGRQRVVVLVQHAFPWRQPDGPQIPGRLYFDGELIDMRSDREAAVLDLLRTAEVRSPAGDAAAPGVPPNTAIGSDDIRRMLTRSPDEILRAMADEMIAFVESDQYRLFAYAVEQTEDPTRYTVWPVAGPSDRNQVLVRLARILGTGLAGARELLDRGTPLAVDVNAFDAAGLLRRYTVEKLPVRIEPPFRWPLF